MDHLVERRDAEFYSPDPNRNLRKKFALSPAEYKIYPMSKLAEGASEVQSYSFRSSSSESGEKHRDMSSFKFLQRNFRHLVAGDVQGQRRKSSEGPPGSSGFRCSAKSFVTRFIPAGQKDTVRFFRQRAIREYLAAFQGTRHSTKGFQFPGGYQIAQRQRLVALSLRADS